MRQLPAIDSRSWKQKRGISAPAASHACSSVYSGGTSISFAVDDELGHARLARPGLAAARVFGTIARQATLSQPKAWSDRPCTGQMLEPFIAVLPSSAMPGRNPPHDAMRCIDRLEPFRPPAVEALVHVCQTNRSSASTISPDRHVDDHVRIVARPTVMACRCRPAAARSKPFGCARPTVHEAELVDETGACADRRSMADASRC